MGTPENAEDISAEVRGRVNAAVHHLRDAHKASKSEKQKEAIGHLAEIMLWLRKNCRRLDGKMDLNGQSREYKALIKRIREAAGDSGDPLDIPTQARHKVTELLFQDPDITDEVRAEYGFGAAPAHIVARRKHDERRSRERAFRRSPLVESIEQLIRDVEQLSLSQLDDASVSDCEAVVEKLSRLETLVRERRDEIGEIF
ncbi:hypothetical protein E1161_13295 [Saccharopolyspora aridisoli]|uniref:Uncharacterized protein n=1 Tax=Saccharopolyspora aridisoli TaxID=2530385 RepID=A0A4R4UT69_9PSEU|nr:hypothetical protein [Saccharopolyspora aridisoli]TDC92344.1 hypothetical protein E1161_13295 [Saccharopolyspora aridisoli]